MKPQGATTRTFRSGPDFEVRRPRRNRKKGPQKPVAGQRQLIVGKLSDDGGGAMPMLKVRMLSGEERLGRKTLRLAKGLGWIALLLVSNMWLAGIVNLALEGSGLAGWLGPSFLMALYGGHLFALSSYWLSEGECQFGAWAVGLFWLGLLGWVPIGALISIFGG